MTPDGSEVDGIAGSSDFAGDSSFISEMNDAHVQATLLPDSQAQVSPPVSPSPIPPDTTGTPRLPDGGQGHAAGGRSSHGGVSGHGHSGHAARGTANDGNGFMAAGSVNQVLNDASKMGGNSNNEL